MIRAVLPSEDRKEYPLATGLLDYFPLAMAEVARCSKIANDQHNPGEPLHWARGKSTDHPNTLLRHLVDRGTIDTDGVRHSAKVAWRALALLQEELEAAGGVPGRASVFPEPKETKLARLNETIPKGATIVAVLHEGIEYKPPAG